LYIVYPTIKEKEKEENPPDFAKRRASKADKRLSPSATPLNYQEEEEEERKNIS